MVRYIQNKEKVTYDSLGTYMLEIVIKNKNNFYNYKDPTGELTNQMAFSKYYNFIMNIGLITKLENKVVNTVDGNILAKLTENDVFNYSLSNSAKIFLFKKILEKDYDYMKIIFRLGLNNQINETMFLNELRNILKENISEENQNILNDLKSWNSAKRYFSENIFAPRRSWLIDLDLIVPIKAKKNSNRLIFKNSDSLIINNVISFDKETFENFYKTSFYYNVSHYYNIPDLILFSKLDEKIKKTMILNILNIEFNKKLIDIKRISSKYFFDFYLTHLLCKEKILIEYIDLENTLNEISEENSQYRYRPVIEYSINREKIDAGYITKVV
jgi:hypothetical protein